MVTLESQTSAPSSQLSKFLLRFCRQLCDDIVVLFARLVAAQSLGSSKIVARKRLVSLPNPNAKQGGMLFFLTWLVMPGNKCFLGL